MPKVPARYNENDVPIYPERGRREISPRRVASQYDGNLPHPANMSIKDTQRILEETYCNVIVRNHADEIYFSEIRGERMEKLHKAACILRVAFARFNMFDIRSFIRTRDRRYLCKQTKVG